MFKIKWILLMAWRDFRQSKGKLMLFASSIVIGIAALVAIISFGENLSNDIDSQAKELLGADFVLSNNQVIDVDSIKALSSNYASEINFASMVAFPANEDSKLSQVRALSGDYPFYGSLTTSPVEARERFKSESGTALIERALLIQL
jgi:putative ABC transport system permease protein